MKSNYSNKSFMLDNLITNNTLSIINYNTSNSTESQLIDKCEHLNATELIYHSSEQYLILCLKLCNLIVRDKCDIDELVDFNRYKLKTAISKTNKLFFADSILNYDVRPSLSTISTSSSVFNSVDYPPNSNSPLLLSHLNETECAKYAHRESYKLSLFVFGIILCFVILTLNSLTLITITKSKRLHNITNILIANLSLSDFLSGIAFLYPCILNILTIYSLETYNSYLYKITCNIRQYYYLCLAGYSPLITSMLSSIFTLTLLAIEKYMAILHPYIYERLINDRKYLCYIILILTWTISIIVSLLPIMGWNEHNKYSSYRGFDCQDPQSLPCMFERIFTLDYILLFTIICFVCAIGMMAIYVRIYMIARKHSKQIENVKTVLNNSNQNNTTNTQNSNININNQEAGFEVNADENEMVTIHSNNSTNFNFSLASAMYQNNNQNGDINSTTTKSINKGMKAMKTLLILLLGFYLCWLPLITYFLTFAGQNYKNSTIYILMFVACCNAVIDPLVYAFRNKDFCKALLLNFRFRNN